MNNDSYYTFGARNERLKSEATVSKIRNRKKYSDDTKPVNTNTVQLKPFTKKLWNKYFEYTSNNVELKDNRMNPEEWVSTISSETLKECDYI